MKFIVNCPKCRQNTCPVREKHGWVIYNEENYGPHKCKVARNAERFLRDSGWYGCKDCGLIVKWIETTERKFKIGPSGNRHRCDERNLSPENRFWSGYPMEYPWEYPVIDGVPILISKETNSKSRPPKTNPVVWTEADDRLMDELGF